MKWKSDTEIRPDGTVHVWPLEEEREHVLHGLNCECCPKTEVWTTGTIVIHNSYSTDGNE